MSDAELGPTPAEPALPDVHTVLRSASVMATIGALGALFLIGLSSERIANAVGVSFGQGALATGVFSSTVVLAQLAYFRCGAGSRAYRFCDALEGFALSFGVAYLIHVSSGVHSFFWIFHGVQVFATALGGLSWVYLTTVCVGPAGLIVAFLCQGHVTSGWLSALAGVSGLFVYLMVARLTSERDAALRRETALRQELGRALVARERARISRDLHDSVATELTALVWRIRELSAGDAPGSRALDIAFVGERLRSVIAELRSVVLSLRDSEPEFAELQASLERRCAELCGQKDFSVSIEGEVPAAELAVFRDQVIPICFELVSNAARHSQARRVELTLRIVERLQIVVSDDGRGLPAGAWDGSRGGLRGVRERVESLDGHVTLETTASGTRFSVDLPRPLTTG